MVKQVLLLLLGLGINSVDGRGHSNETCREFLPKKTKVTLYYTFNIVTSCTLLTRRSTLVLKWAYHAGGKAFKRRVTKSLTVIILTLYYCEKVLSLMYWSIKTKCICVVTHSLVMNLCSRDFLVM